MGTNWVSLYVEAQQMAGLNMVLAYKELERSDKNYTSYAIRLLKPLMDQKYVLEYLRIYFLSQVSAFEIKN